MGNGKWDAQNALNRDIEERELKTINNDFFILSNEKSTFFFLSFNNMFFLIIKHKCK